MTDKSGSSNSGVDDLPDCRVDLAAQAALEQSELRSSTVLRMVPDGILITRMSDGSYVDVNEGFTTIAGYEPAELIGRRVADIDPWDDSAERGSFTSALRSSGQVSAFEATFRHKNGSLVETLVSAKVIELDGEPHVLSVATDVSDLKAAERRVRALNRVYAVLGGVNQALVHMREPRAIFDEACRVMVEDGGFRGAWVGLVEPDGVHVRPVSSAGVALDCLEGADTIVGHAEPGRGPAGIAIAEGRHVVIQDAQHVSATAERSEGSPGRDVRSAASFPLTLHGETVGALSIGAGELNFFDDEQIRLLDELAADISYALELAEHEELRSHGEEALVQSERWLHESQRVARLGHYVYDVAKDWWDGSPTLYEVLGVDDDYQRDFAGWLDTVHPMDRENMSRYFTEEVLGKREPFDTIYRVVRHSDGAERWVHGLGTVDFAEEGTPLRMFGTIQDVTERRRVEETHQAILRTAMDGFFITDASGHLCEVNDAYCNMSGYSEQELLGMTIADLEVLESPEEANAHTARIFAKRSDVFESKHRRKDGTVYDVETSARYQPEVGRIAAFLRDITAGKQRAAYSALGREILGTLNGREELHELLPLVVEAIKTRLDIDAVGIRLKEGEDFPYIAERGFDERFLVTENTLLDRDEDGAIRRDETGAAILECTCGLVLSGRGDPLLTPGGSFWTNDSTALLDLPAGDDPRLRPRNVCMHEGYVSMALVPIRGKDGIVGLLHLNSRQGGRFSSETVELLEGIAASMGSALMRRHAEERLARSFQSIVNVVGRVAEIRDPYTAGHQRRVAELCVAICEDMGMPPETVEEIRIAALIHDIGKMSIPAEILSKPGKLMDIEFNMIKRHSEAGYEIITAADMGGSTADIVLQHHERCDGSGYPRGLSARQLLPGSKVVMVADVVEAMMSHRPYRAALGANVALGEIEKNAGTLYDSQIAGSCLRVFAQGFAFTEG